MIKRTLLILLLAATGLFAMLEPEPVPRKTKRSLDKASYIELAQQWKKYIEAQGESARALTNLALAYRYSDQIEAAKRASEKALALNPDYPPALDELGGLLSQDSATEDRALKLLEHCRAVAPDYEQGLNMLAVIYLKMGELDKADEVFKDIHSQNLIQRPLVDYGYNMLVGLPEGAVLFTNGDNDTFPPLVLQAGMGFRRDVAVINRSLINVEKYRKALFERYPEIAFDRIPEKLSRGPVTADPVVRKLLEDAKAPLFFAKTYNWMIDKPELDRGFNDMVIGTGKQIPVNEAAKTILFSFRLDSATDWTFPWKLYPQPKQQMINYVQAITEVAEHDNFDPILREKLLDKALQIAEFHDHKNAATVIRKQLKK